MDSCWLYARGIDKHGYGVIAYKLNKVWKFQYAHRAMYEDAKGAIPKGLVIDHLCRVRNCINPSHLEAVTNAENISRGANPKIVAHKNGTCLQGHDKSNFQRRRNGLVVRCKVCRKLDAHKNSMGRHMMEDLQWLKESC